MFIVYDDLLCANLDLVSTLDANDDVIYYVMYLLGFLISMDVKGTISHHS